MLQFTAANKAQGFLALSTALIVVWQRSLSFINFMQIESLDFHFQ